MREHYEAAGRVAAAAIANGDRIVNSYNEKTNKSNSLGLQIQSRGVNIQIDASPSSSHLTTAVDRRFSYMDGFDPDQLPTVAEAEDVLLQDRELLDFDGRINTLAFQPDGVDQSFYDGVRVVRPIYAYNNDFGIKQYREVVQDLVFRSAEAFDSVSTAFNIEMDADEALEETTETTSSSRSFQ